MRTTALLVIFVAHIVAALAIMTATPASAQAQAGTIVYTQGGNIFITTPGRRCRHSR